MAEAYEKVYTIQIAYHSLSQYMKETHVDNKCKNAVNVLGSQWMELVLLPKILENHECIFELKVNKNRLYPEKRRYGVPYWYIHCVCKLKMCGVMVKLECTNRPEDTEDYIFNVKSFNHNKDAHNEAIAHPRVKGPARVDLAESILLHHNGSVKRYAETQRSKGIVGLPGDSTMFKVLDEYRNRDMVSTNWITNLHHQQDTILFFY